MQTIRKIDDSSNTQRAAYLDNLRAVAIVMIVAVHALSYCGSLAPHTGDIILFIVHTISVPAFFLVDGFLLAQSTRLAKAKNYTDFMQKSVHRLLVPWLIFTVSYMGVRYAFEVSGIPDKHYLLGLDWAGIALAGYGAVAASQMYFLLSLFLIRAIAPLIIRIFCTCNLATPTIIFIGYCVLYNVIAADVASILYIENGQEPITHAIWGLQFYIFGILIFNLSQRINLKKLFYPALLVFIAALLLKKSPITIDPFIQYIYLLVFFLLFNFFRGDIGFLKLLGQNTMGIYLTHAPIVIAVVSLVINKLVAIPVVSFFLIVAVSVMVSLCIAIILSKFYLGRVITGVQHAHKR